MPDGLSFTETLARYRDNLRLRVERGRTYVWWYLVSILLGPTVLVLGPFLWHPRPTGKPIGAVAALVALIAMILVVRRASLNTYQKRIDQLGVVAERL